MRSMLRSPKYGVAILALLAACGVVTPTPPPAPTAASVTPPATVTPPPAAPAKTAEKSTPSPAATPASAPAAKPTAAPKASAPAEAKKAPAAAPPAAASKAPPPVAAASPAPVAAAAPPPVDLKSLEQKLKESSAIGVMTKLSLKNQVDDLVSQFRAFHDGRRPPTLPELRPHYDLLLMKILALLQDRDPGLAKALNDSREFIWGVLADRAKFLQNL